MKTAKVINNGLEEDFRIEREGLSAGCSTRQREEASLQGLLLMSALQY